MSHGFDLVSGGTDNHLVLIDLTSKGISGKQAARALETAGIVCNANSVPFDPASHLIRVVSESEHLPLRVVAWAQMR